MEKKRDLSKKKNETFIGARLKKEKTQAYPTNLTVHLPRERGSIPCGRKSAKPPRNRIQLYGFKPTYFILHADDAIRFQTDFSYRDKTSYNIESHEDNKTSNKDNKSNKN